MNGTYTSLKSIRPFSSFGGDGAEAYTATTFATFADSLTTLGHGAVNLTADHLLIRDGTEEKEISFSNMVFAGHRVGTVETTANGSNRIATINTAGNIIRRISISDLFTQHGGGTGTTFTLNNDDMADYFSDVLPSFGSQTPSEDDYIMYYSINSDNVRRMRFSEVLDYTEMENFIDGLSDEDYSDIDEGSRLIMRNQDGDLRKVAIAAMFGHVWDDAGSPSTYVDNDRLMWWDLSTRITRTIQFSDLSDYVLTEGNVASIISGAVNDTTPNNNYQILYANL